MTIELAGDETWALTGAGVALILLAARVAARTVLLRRNGIIVNGTIVGFDERTRDDMYSVAAMIEFRTLDGRKVLVKDEYSTNVRWEDVGEHVPVMYDPHAPHRALRAAGSRQITVPLAFAGGGLLFVATGLGWLGPVS